MIDLFISHNKAEKEWTRDLAAELKKRGIRYFLDEESIGLGENVIEAIGKGLQNSRHVALIISPDSVKSRWVELEWASALYDDVDASKKKLIPVLKHTCEIPYMLRRLKYLDARDLDVVAVAEKLAAEIRSDSNSPDESTEAKLTHRSTIIRKLPFFGPMPPYSRNYIRRDADNRIEQIVAGGRSAVVYGPRQIGKTSLLNQIAADLTLMGRTCIFVDATSLLRSGGEVIWAYIAHRIADALNAHLESESTFPIALQVHRLINSIRDNESLVLLLDEADVLASSKDPVTMGILRSLVNDPMARGRLSIVCAGLQPHIYFEPDPAFSPWWNPFELVRLQGFSLQETREFARQIGMKLSKAESQTVYNLTAGHPRMVGTLFQAIDRGHSIRDIQRDPLKPAFELAIHALHTFEAAKRMLGASFSSTIKALTKRKQIPVLKTREVLWFAGVTRDPDENPPVCSDVFLRICRDVQSKSTKHRKLFK